MNDPTEKHRTGGDVMFTSKPTFKSRDLFLWAAGDMVYRKMFEIAVFGVPETGEVVFKPQIIALDYTNIRKTEN